MKKFLSVFLPLAFLAGILIFSCNDEIVTELTGSIIGNISDKTTGEPIATANVTLEPEGISVTTGSDGNFSFVDVQEGSYTIEVLKEGYVSAFKSISVYPGKQAEANFVLERVPAVVTVDRDILEFGDGSDVNSLSFNIVNPSYEDLEWSIEYDCPWIKSVKDSEGTLKYGRTQTIVVFIDRTKLDAGENKTILVVRSSNGSSDLKVTAIGIGKRDVVLNTLDVQDITSSSAILMGQIVDDGQPPYTERGFVYSTTSRPSEANTIEVLTAVVTQDKEYSVKVGDLEFRKKYYVRAYAKSELGTFYSSNEVSFIVTGTEPEVSIQAVTSIDIEKKTAILNATIENVGDPAYTERGFVYSTKNNPTIFDTKIISQSGSYGKYSERISGLSDDEVYYVRAYAENANGVVYSAEEVSFSIHIPEYIKMDNLGLMVQLDDAGKGYWETMKSLCNDLQLEGFTDWRLPTKSELTSLYTIKGDIGGFKDSKYWSSSSAGHALYYYIDFMNGEMDYSYGSDNQFYARCVRSITTE